MILFFFSYFKNLIVTIYGGMGALIPSSPLIKETNQCHKATRLLAILHKTGGD